ncbi:MAG: T9SS type A sorting domain-containing protein [Flavobacteriales bacterium]|nr:T9SS type A sorting domain-containing protein [Flavobacteriales bacterium]
MSYPVQARAGLLELLDMQGRVVYRNRLAAWSQVHAVELEEVQAGMYQCKLQWGGQSTAVRIIVIEP